MKDKQAFPSAEYNGMTLKEYYEGIALGAWIQVLGPKVFLESGRAIANEAANLAKLSAEVMLKEGV